MGFITILHTADMHGNARALPGLQEQLKKPNTLWLDCGDAITGSNTLFHWHEDMLARMNDGGCGAMAMGNREFNYWRRVLACREEQRRFPLLCANLVDLRTKPSAPWDDLYPSLEYGQGAFPFWTPYITLDVGDVGLLLTGFTPVQYPHGCFWEKFFKFSFLQPEECCPALLAHMEKHVPDMASRHLVVLSHLGLEVDRRLAAMLPVHSTILGGHTHTNLAKPEVVNDSRIYHVGAFGERVGKVVIRK